MAKVRVRVRVVTVCLLVLSMGLHWALLQTVAWTGMLISYSRNGTFLEAVTKTFDGQHPCSLCKVVKSGRTEEKKQEQKQVKPGLELEVGLIWTATEFQFAEHHERVPLFGSSMRSRADAPPRPPPRVVCDHHACA
jgi:hypothetical protein